MCTESELIRIRIKWTVANNGMDKISKCFLPHNDLYQTCSISVELHQR